MKNIDVKIAWLAVVVNAFLAVGKILIGILGGATSVLADGVHSLMDVVGSSIAVFGINKAKKPPDKDHPYGHYKFEVLSSLFVTAILFVTGIFILYEAIRAFINPKTLKLQTLSMITMIVSASLNEIMARIKIYFGKKENSLSLLSDGIHSRMDVYTSIAVFVGLILDRYWIYSDATLAVVVGLLVMKESINLAKEASDSLLDASAGEEVETMIRKEIESSGIKLVDLKTQKKGPVITANLKIALPNNVSVEKASKVSNNIKHILADKINNLEYISIQIDNLDITTSYFSSKNLGTIDWENRKKLGPEGYCVCPNCGYEEEHKRGLPCAQRRCPRCGTEMKRKT